MPKKKKKGYLSNKEFYAEIIRCQDIGVMSEKLGTMFNILSERFASKPNFAGYSYKDEMIASGLVACCAAFMKFNREKTENPFAYFTQVLYSAFLQVLNKEKKHQEIRDKLLLEYEKDASRTYMEKHSGDEYEG